MREPFFGKFIIKKFLDRANISYFKQKRYILYSLLSKKSNRKDFYDYDLWL